MLQQIAGGPGSQFRNPQGARQLVPFNRLRFFRAVRMPPAQGSGRGRGRGRARKGRKAVGFGERVTPSVWSLHTSTAAGKVDPAPILQHMPTTPLPPPVACCSPRPPPADQASQECHALCACRQAHAHYALSVKVAKDFSEKWKNTMLEAHCM
jgi:hypothetical protein